MMETSPSTPEQFRERLIAAARDLGVDRLGIARAQTVDSDRERLLEWLTKGYHAGMSWISRDPDKRSQIDRVLPGARSVISVAINYSTDVSSCDDCGALKVSRFAWGEDYHRVVGRKLKTLTDLLTQWAPDAKSLFYVDTGPIMEKAWAQRAGIGWTGKNGSFLTRSFGSWVFLGEILTTIELPADEVHADFCGSCTRCIDSCPTNAITEPYVVDSQKCIAYWTIEHRGEFPEGIAEDLDGWIFGCDVCQDVCPWNSFEKPTRELAFVPRQDAVCPPADKWAALTEDEFQLEFADSALRRVGREGLARNIRSQRQGPLESVLRILDWKTVDGLQDEDATLDGKDR
jgi:epoxyqueuosine reductase